MRFMCVCSATHLFATWNDSSNCLQSFSKLRMYFLYLFIPKAPGKNSILANDKHQTFDSSFRLLVDCFPCCRRTNKQKWIHVHIWFVFLFVICYSCVACAHWFHFFFISFRFFFNRLFFWFVILTVILDKLFSWICWFATSTLFLPILALSIAFSHPSFHLQSIAECEFADVVQYDWTHCRMWLSPLSIENCSPLLSAFVKVFYLYISLSLDSKASICCCCCYLRFSAK